MWELGAELKKCNVGFGAFPWCGLQGLYQRPPVVSAASQVPMMNVGQVRWCSNLFPRVLTDVAGVIKKGVTVCDI